jgi:hypothetical protein
VGTVADLAASVWFRYLLLAVLALAVVGLLAYARGAPGDDGRTPEHEGAIALVVTAGD